MWRLGVAPTNFDNRQGRRPDRAVLLGLAAMGLVFGVSRNARGAEMSGGSECSDPAALVNGNAWSCGELVGRWGYGPAWGVATSGNYAYLGSGTMLLVLDVSNATSPQVTGALDVTGVVRGIAVSGSRVFVAADETGLAIFAACGPPCADPTITDQPQGQQVVSGEAAALFVTASGTAPLTYRWNWGAAGDTASPVGFNAPTFNTGALSSTASYWVRVCNTCGCADSEAAVVTVESGPPPRDFDFGTATSPVAAGYARVSPATTYNAARGLGWLVGSVGSRDRGSGTDLTRDFNFTGDGTFAVDQPDGAYQVTVTMGDAHHHHDQMGLHLEGSQMDTISTGVGEVLTRTYQVSVGDGQLTLRLVDQGGSDANAVINALEIVEVSGFEGDVAPRPDGDGAVNGLDWVQSGRFAAALDAPAVGSELQRADCAPRATVGNGSIDITDWVQNGRYAAGLDPVTPVGGPTGPGLLVPSPLASATRAKGEARVISLPDVRLEPGETFELQVTLTARGNENAVAFSVAFDPWVFRVAEVVTGRDISSATLQVNRGELARGRIGLALALPACQAVASGLRELVVLRILVTETPSGKTSRFSFTDLPVRRGVASPTAAALPASFDDAVAVRPPRAVFRPDEKEQ